MTLRIVKDVKILILENIKNYVEKQMESELQNSLSVINAWNNIIQRDLEGCDEVMKQIEFTWVKIKQYAHT